jgi:hypothetical protein
MGGKISIDGGQTQIPRGEQETSGDYSYGQRLDRAGTKGPIAGSEPVGIYRANSSGGDPRASTGARTGGKIFACLIEILADQKRDSEEALERERARLARINAHLEQLQEALATWESSLEEIQEDLPPDA